MIIGGMPLATWLAGHVDIQDAINAAFATAAGWFWCGNVVQAWRDEEIKGMRPGVLLLYITWGIYCVVFMATHHAPLSAYAFGFLTASNLLYAISYWVFVGPFNYDKRSHRLRWWLLRRVKSFMNTRPSSTDMMEALAESEYLWRRPGSPTMHELRGPAWNELGDPNLPDANARVSLPEHQCNTCGFKTRHDLDGHCIICDTKNMGA